MATAIKQRMIFQRGDDQIEFVLRKDINRGAAKTYRVILNGVAVDWAYSDHCARVQSTKTAEFYFQKHVR